eukprot:CAMPEP_0115040222 /NCGR_PEP_ID=MMETSP0216-20121206/44657_1 /TAXON_ID=223996 /ORGANISM="Protocruzia adherens, Strain Boccale" /LENGTH=341 /DNA_ID=CAMNT_0002421335 /DNA_START=148 /DNA_END=1173 /DNA_ORIENTATION=+
MNRQTPSGATTNTTGTPDPSLKGTMVITSEENSKFQVEDGMRSNYNSILARTAEEAKTSGNTTTNQTGNNADNERKASEGGEEELRIDEVDSIEDALADVPKPADREVVKEFNMDFVKSGDAIRKHFLEKLSYKNVWLSHENKAKKHQNMIIFDWDDTLLCTSYLNPIVWGEEIDPEEVSNSLRNLENSVISMLKLALRMGHVFIITNAAEGWVEHSSQRFLPAVCEYLKQIKVISARRQYEWQFPGDCHQWKIAAFLEMTDTFDTGMVTNLVALGDSNYEIDAAHHLAKRFESAFIKTIKFRENPRPDELVKQLDLVCSKFENICLSVRNLTIRLERKSS